MEYHEIEELLNRYLEGESTLEEEAMLKQYFSQPELPPGHREMQELFRYFVATGKESDPPFDMTVEINSVIERELNKEHRSRFRLLFVWVAGTAAVLAVSFGIYRYTYRTPPVVNDTFSDPKMAYLETKRALLMVSRAMNRNTASLKYLANIDKSFNKVQKISEIDKVVSSVKK
jgi:hypothetical protein